MLLGTQPALFGGAKDQYKLSRSLRLYSNDNAYLSRAQPAVSGNRKTFTFSFWFKRGYTGQNLYPLTSNEYPADPGNYLFMVRLRIEDRLEVYDYPNTYQLSISPSRLYQDTSRWYHLVVAYDTTQAVAADRCKIYSDGVLETAFNAAPLYPALNALAACNHPSYVRYIGVSSAYAAYTDVSVADYYFIDGFALTASDFGETVGGAWVPKKYTGAYGAQGHHLDFADASNNTAATLGKDTSGNGFNFTPTNVAVAAAHPALNDAMPDVPTKWGVDTGLGGEVRGNYAVMATNVGFSSGGQIVRDGGLQPYVDRTTYNAWCKSPTPIPATGKWYFEWYAYYNDSGTFYNCVGVISSDTARTTQWTGATMRALRCDNGNKQTSAGPTAYGGTGAVNTDRYMCAIDMTTGSIYFGKNGQWANGTNAFNQPWATAVAAFTDLVSSGKTWHPMSFAVGGTISVNYVNFGQQPFGVGYCPPGYKCLVSTNF